MLDDVANSCAAICRAHLPEATGYEFSRTHLDGALDGVTLEFKRGNFRGLVSVQRFEHAATTSAPTQRARTLRLVAEAHHEPPPDEAAQTRSCAYWTATGGAAGTMAVGIVALALTGALTAWGSILLLVPALFGTRVCMALWMADTMRQRALGPATSDRGLPPARTSAETRDLRRWNAVLEELAAQYETTAELFQLRPFRGLSTAPHAVVAPACSDAPGKPPIAALSPVSP